MVDKPSLYEKLFLYVLQNEGKVNIPKKLFLQKDLIALNDYLKIMTRFHTQEELDWQKEKYWLTDEDLK